MPYMLRINYSSGRFSRKSERLVFYMSSNSISGIQCAPKRYNFLRFSRLSTIGDDKVETPTSSRRIRVIGTNWAPKLVDRRLTKVRLE